MYMHKRLSKKKSVIQVYTELSIKVAKCSFGYSLLFTLGLDGNEWHKQVLLTFGIFNKLCPFFLT